MRQFWDGRWYDEERYPAGPPAEDVGDPVPASPPSTAPAPVDAPATSSTCSSSAPYAAGSAPERDGVDLHRPWREAGRSLLAAADRADAARSGAMVWTGRRTDVATRLRARATAARRAAKVLQPMTGSGWVVLHDRHLGGTSVVIDHVLVGPPGVVVLHNRCALTVSRDHEGWPWADQVPLNPEREQMATVRDQVLERVAAGLPGWQVWTWSVLLLHARTPWAADYSSPTLLLTPSQVPTALETLHMGLAPMHVRDLAMQVEQVCPPAPLGLL